METNNLQTFLSIIDSGSFTKTAEENFISSTAVMKQINKLEAEMDTKLFKRSNNGVVLTPAGKKFQGYAHQILALSQKAYIDCHNLTQKRKIIRLGTSLLHPSQPFMATWHRIRPEISGYELQIVQLPAALAVSNREYAMLGKKCDIMIGTFDQATTRRLVEAVPLGCYHFSIAVRSDNPLAAKSALTFADLRGQTVLMVPKGISEKNDLLRARMLTKVPDLQIRYTPGRYDLQVFNQTVANNWALVNLTPWLNIHPNLVSIPLKTSIKVDYGVLASKKADSEVKNFLAILRRLVLQNKADPDN